MSELERHLDVAARWLIRRAVEEWTGEGWEDLGDVGEYDYERICEATMARLPADVTGEEWTETYDFFAARAEGET